MGWGVDMWMCWRGWKAGMRNILDGKVRLSHPPDTGYDHKEALTQMRYLMEVYGGQRWGPEMRCHPWYELFENNLREVWIG
jgi:hypothetical protein